jgi:hypothetical protein
MQSLQSALPFNFQHLLAEQAEYVAYCISEMKRRGIVSMEPTKEGEEAYTQLIVSMAPLRQSFFESW